MDFYTTFKQVREKHRLSYAKLAQIIGTDRKRLATLEKERSPIPFHMYNLLAKALSSIEPTLTQDQIREQMLAHNDSLNYPFRFQLSTRTIAQIRLAEKLNGEIYNLSDDKANKLFGELNRETI